MHPIWKVRTPSPRRGLSLLEVILAIAVLGGSLAVIGELIRTGTRHAEEARELATAQILCESRLESVAAGILGTESVSAAPCEEDDRFQYSIEVTTLDESNLLEVRVTVEQTASEHSQPLSFSLVRWMIAPSTTGDDGTTPPTTGVSDPQ